MSLSVVKMLIISPIFEPQNLLIIGFTGLAALRSFVLVYLI